MTTRPKLAHPERSPAVSRTESLNFLTFLQTFRRGRLVQDADDYLSEIVEAVQETGGTGKLVLELPVKMNKGGQLEITPRIKIDKPRPSVGTGVYFATPEGRLSRTDPAQMDIEDLPGVGRGDAVN